MNNPKSKKVTLGAATLLSLTTMGSVQAENISLKFHSGLSQSRPEA